MKKTVKTAFGDEPAARVQRAQSPRIELEARDTTKGRARNEAEGKVELLKLDLSSLSSLPPWFSRPRSLIPTWTARHELERHADMVPKVTNEQMAVVGSKTTLGPSRPSI